VEKATLAVGRARAEAESGIKSSEARLEFGVKRFVRTEEMFKKELIPERERDEAETGKVLAEMALLEAQENRRIAELELERAEAAYRLRTLRSPINGVVVERLLASGELAKQSPILKLAQIDPLRVEVFAPVSLLGKVSTGMNADVMPEAPVNGVYPARVTVVDRVVDAASGTFGVRLELPNPSHRLPAGLKCMVRFPTD
jgi:multidrug efflux pump subunit AcrA (membrane-fusion protein)